MDNCCYLSSIPLLYTIIRHRLLFKSIQKCFNEKFDYSIKIQKSKPKLEESKKEVDDKKEKKEEDKEDKEAEKKEEKKKEEKEKEDEDKDEDKKEEDDDENKEKEEKEIKTPQTPPPPLLQPDNQTKEYISKYKYPEIPPLIHDEKKIDFIDFVLIFAVFSPTVKFEQKVECIILLLYCYSGL